MDACFQSLASDRCPCDSLLETKGFELDHQSRKGTTTNKNLSHSKFHYVWVMRAVNGNMPCSLTAHLFTAIIRHQLSIINFCRCCQLSTHDFEVPKKPQTPPKLYRLTVLKYTSCLLPAQAVNKNPLAGAQCDHNPGVKGVCDYLRFPFLSVSDSGSCLTPSLHGHNFMQ